MNFATLARIESFFVFVIALLIASRDESVHLPENCNDVEPECLTFRI
jgi:hypothetical protein